MRDFGNEGTQGAVAILSTGSQKPTTKIGEWEGPMKKKIAHMNNLAKRVMGRKRGLFVRGGRTKDLPTIIGKKKKPISLKIYR